MKKIVLVGLLVLLVVAISYVLYAYNLHQKGIKNGTVVNLMPGNKNAQEVEPVDYEIVEVANGLYTPWDIEFTSSERFLVSERNGNIKEVVGGSVNQTPLIHLDEVVEESESGLMGLAVHPNYSSNKYVYACLTYRKNGTLTDKIERFIDNGASLSRDKVIFDEIPAARNHAGCRIKFGPDQKLYITSGDAQTRSLPQDLKSLGGKILRINDDGTIPADNPFGNAIWSYGHRNPQGIAWSSEGLMFETEHGPSGNDGPGGGDEVNFIKKGANYGWPLVSHEKSQEEMESPKLIFTPAEAPAGAMFYTRDVYPQFKNNFFFTALRGAGIFRVVLNGEDVESFEKMDVSFGRIREIEESPDGLIYFTTSNRDGRGRVRDGDDKVYRFEPR